MLSRLASMALVGIEALPCEIEVDVASRAFDKAVIVGLPDTAVKESLERVPSALHNSGYEGQVQDGGQPGPRPGRRQPDRPFKALTIADLDARNWQSQIIAATTDGRVRLVPQPRRGPEMILTDPTLDLENPPSRSQQAGEPSSPQQA